jgi:hypothetical protein
MTTAMVDDPVSPLPQAGGLELPFIHQAGNLGANAHDGGLTG